MTITNIKKALKSIKDESELLPEWLSDNRKGVQQALVSWRKEQEKSKILHETLQQMLVYEKNLWKKQIQLVAGIDEVGRGPLAGPVVAACVIMPTNDFILSINDSKQLSEKKRNDLFELILNKAISVGVGVVDEAIIDKVNIYQATKLAMQLAIDNSSIQPEHLLIDAMSLDNGMSQTSIIKGDATSYSIAAASIVAKVYRDKLMKQYAKKYPQYSFDKNAGYGTANHLKAIKDYGITPIHRKSFEPIKSMLKK